MNASDAGLAPRPAGVGVGVAVAVPGDVGVAVGVACGVLITEPGELPAAAVVGPQAATAITRSSAEAPNWIMKPSSSLVGGDGRTARVQKTSNALDAFWTRRVVGSSLMVKPSDSRARTFVVRMVDDAGRQTRENWRATVTDVGTGERRIIASYAELAAFIEACRDRTTIRD